MKKATLLTLALLAAPALAVASPEIAVRQSPPPETSVRQSPAPCARVIVDEFRIVRILPDQITMESVIGPHIKINRWPGFDTAYRLRVGERIYLKVAVSCAFLSTRP